ncbi:zinc ribbon domain-containing protein [Synechococcus sp. A18-25c]|uniref:zinc ribbon domain-containing protein n=1 Tax=Synechococcus sp. A18-25c TaxID=1866938 RepID=UPI0016457E4B|nr:zinc ribbon domain-containing protein [Synechococcus sp. A18-25c]
MAPSVGFSTGYVCSECGCTSYETGQIRVSGGFWSSFFDIGNRRYNAVTCTNCGYTKFYRRSVSGVQKVFDFLGSN